MLKLNLLIKQKALEAGFDMVGIAPVGVWKDLDFARRWVEQGYGGEMHYLQNPKRDDPRQVLPSAQSVVCVGLIYNAPLPYSTEVAEKAAIASVHPGVSQRPQFAQDHLEALTHGWISRYGWGQDYHEILRAKLEELRKAIESVASGAETRVYVDTGPVVERAFARHSGIGWMGKNTCLINQTKGSWFFLGVLLTNLQLDPDLPAADRCGSCTRCLDACPTGALVKPYVMDASRCIAYFTIELKDTIPEEYRPAIGSNVFGCDICQDVCPWNQRKEIQESGIRQPQATDNGQRKGFGRANAATTDLPAFQPLDVTFPASVAGQLPSVHASLPNAAGVAQGKVDDSSTRTENPTFSLFNPPLEALAELGEDDFRRAFARSPIKRAKYRGWLRNLCVVMGNSGNHQFIPKLKELARHDDPIVREHAEWAIKQLEVTGAPEAPDQIQEL
ncbi:MAG: tRNA epoxyqueuosine(34) reductase QueG [Acidobacteria bacterium]|nr:tRNA epoxyqueuosine(34) reductase QueG [Acidobacteriota bacterium]